MTSVSFVETSAQALSKPLSSAIVAAGAEAEYALSKAGLSFTVPDDYFSAEDVRSIKAESLGRVYRLCAELDEKAARLFRDAPGFLPFSTHLFSIRHLFDHALYTAWRADRILSRRPIEKAFFFQASAEPIGEGLFFQRESIWSSILPLICRAKGVSFEILPPVPERRPSFSWRKAASGIAHAAAGMARNIRARGKPNHAELIFLTRNYSLGSLMDLASKEMSAQLWRVDNWQVSPTPTDRSSMLALWEDWRNSRAKRRYFIYEEVDLFPVLERRLRHLFVDLIPRAAALNRAFAARLDAKRPKAVLAATMTWREKAAAAAARTRGIPFAVYLHGNIGTRHTEIIYDNDMAWSDLYIVSGGAQKEYCETAFPQAKTRVIAAGSAALEGLQARLTPEDKGTRRRLGLRTGQRSVIYSLSGVRDFRFPQYHRTESANYQLQRRLVDFFAGFPEIHFFVKLYTSDWGASPIARRIADLKLPNVKALTEPPMSELLGAADAFVIDFPSTTLSEMALTSKPIYFIDALSSLDWIPRALDSVRRRCSYFADLDAAQAAMRRDFTADNFSPVKDRDYVLNYGLCEEDGRSLLRARDALFETIGASRG